jgi:hypothetical protein
MTGRIWSLREAIALQLRWKSGPSPIRWLGAWECSSFGKKSVWAHFYLYRLLRSSILQDYKKCSRRTCLGSEVRRSD